jgi:hypothetical protein
MVVFNVLNNKDEKPSLIYNYRQYNNIFLDCFYAYIMNEQMSMLIHKNSNIGSGYFFLIDEKISVHEKLKIKLDRNIEFFDLYERKGVEKMNMLNIIDIYKLIVKGKPHSLSIQDMSIIIELLHKKELNFLGDKLGKLSNLYANEIYIKKAIDRFMSHSAGIYNLINRFIFIVQDLDSLINNMKKLDFKSVNQGPQSQRGSGSYINYILTTLDDDFRKSMHRHNKLFASRGIGVNHIHKAKFSYNNIHNNLGFVRRYSTVVFKSNLLNYKTVNKSLIFSPKSDDVAICAKKINTINKSNCCGLIEEKSTYISKLSINVNKRFYSSLNKANNYVLFKEVKDILSNNPLNHDTQIEIEKLLINNNMSKWSNNNLKIYDVIGRLNKDLKEQLMLSDKQLNSLIKNYKDRKLLDKYKGKKLTKKEIPFFYLSTILDVVSIDYVVSILIGKFLMIMNNSTQDDNYTTKVFIDLGDYLINHYFYVLYTQEKKRRIKASNNQKLNYNMWD